MRTLWILVAACCVLLVAGKSLHTTCDAEGILKKVRNACSVRPKRSPDAETPLTREHLLSQLGALRGGRRTQRAIRSNFEKLMVTCCRTTCQDSDFAAVCNARIHLRK